MQCYLEGSFHKKLGFLSTSVFFLFQLSGVQAIAWDQHSKLTQLSLQTLSISQSLYFEDIESVLPSLVVTSSDGTSSIAKTQAEFAEQLRIHGDKVDWNKFSSTNNLTTSSALDVLLYSADEPDLGMDQNLTLTDYQQMMGGYSGPGSQAIRHMYYPAWDWRAPVVTFHLPFQVNGLGGKSRSYEMGFGPERAALYFSLALQAKKNGHLFWAHRFLGWSLHYLQDLSQPYHATQFAALSMLLLSPSNWSGFVDEVTRRVSNFHLSFERYVEFLIHSQGSSADTLFNAFLVPSGDEKFRKELLENNLPATPMQIQSQIESVAKKLAGISGILSSSVFDSQNALIGELLFKKELNLLDSFYTSTGSPKIQFSEIELDKKSSVLRQDLYKKMADALSNCGVVTRWAYEQFSKN